MEVESKKNQKGTYSQRVLIITASLLILFVGLWLIFTQVWRSFQNVFYYQAKISQAQKEEEIQKERLAKVQRIFDEFNSQKESRETLSLSLPQIADYTQIESELNSMAALSSLELKNETFSEKTIHFTPFRYSRREESKKSIVKPYSVISLNLQGVGYYLPVKNFLQLVEKDIRLMDVENFEISVFKASGNTEGSVSESNPRVSFRFLIDLYKQETK